jgi:hypothetical protein
MANSKIIRILQLSGFIIFLLASKPCVADNLCHNDTRRIGKCFDISGVLTIYANSRIYLLNKDTSKIIYSIAMNIDKDTYLIPEKIIELIDYEKDIVAIYKICPIKKEDFNRYDVICIKSAKNIKLK